MRKELKDAFTAQELRQKPLESDYTRFLNALDVLRKNTNETESEEHNKNLVSTFLKDAFYGTSHKINTHGRIDMAIFEDDHVSVIIESKSPSNKSEFPSSKDINCKALQELVLYYMQQRIEEKNLSIKHLIITNNFEWYVFDATVFEKYFAECKEFLRASKEFLNGQTASTKTHDYYGEIAKPRIEEIKSDLDYVHFNLKENLSMQHLVQIYKLLSPSHLLKQIEFEDSNSLNTSFYNELLYIIGLEEHTEGGKTLIGRCSESTRKENSLLESTIYQLSDRGYSEVELFEKSLNLVITWINRILFLKLLESQLISYHNAAEANDYRFLTIKNIYDYDGLNELFFKVLAVREGERHSSVAEKYAKVPYLNSSLFERTKGELDGIEISGLKMGSMPLYGRTILKDIKGRRIEKETSTLEYLFSFLDAYDFGSEQNDELTKAETKTLINASVLGLIFEKINGYKDGSFFTPGIITEYMSREVLQMLVVQKFNEAKGCDCQSLTDVYNEIDDRIEANEIINSITICDPAVGSGHFLVSALNEIIAIKSELGILMSKEGRRLRDWNIFIENDELIVQEKETGNLFHYNTRDEESRIVQETLFNEKRRIIENSLFGVDLNPNAVNICRLRLWIELLKYAYYHQDGTLETLPNIDINIKCGNSLISKYPVKIGESIGKSSNLRKEIAEYKAAVKAYKKTADKADKRRVIEQIKIIKSKISEAVQLDLFDKEANQRAIENNIYSNSMEWMIEFPEILDEDGRFLGFDAVIGNPPYVVTKKGAYKGYKWDTDLYKMFIEVAFNCFMKAGAILGFITPKFFLLNKDDISMRDYFLDKSNVLLFALCNPFDAVTENVITIAKKEEPRTNQIRGLSYNNATCSFDELPIIEKDYCKTNAYHEIVMGVNPRVQQLLKKMSNGHVTLQNISISKRGAEVSKNFLREAETGMKALIGGDMKKFSIEWDNTYLPTSHKEYARLSSFFSKDLLLLRRVDSCLEAAMSTDDPYAFNKNVYGISINKSSEFSPLFILGWLNSKAVDFYYKKKFSTKKDGAFPEIQTYLYEQLPIPQGYQTPIIDLVNQILKAKKANRQTDTSSFEQQIDRLVYELYGLTNGEVKIIDPEAEVSGADDELYKA